MKNRYFPLFLVILIVWSSGVFSQNSFRVLHYSETSGFDHQTRQSSLVMLQQLGNLHNFIVDDDQTGTTFQSLSSLQQYAVIVFANTSGDAILDSLEKANFEDYINNGGSFAGIHAASDTYRHSTANGNFTGSWDWYAELIGASVQHNPAHVNGTPAYTLFRTSLHPSVDNIPDPWVKDEEYYYWENGYYNSGNIPVLKVEETVGPNGQVNSYDTTRPMSWYRILPAGGRVFYTALGHANYNYTTDTSFRNHIRDAILWTAGVNNLWMTDVDRELFELYPDPVSTELILENLPENWVSIEVLNSGGTRVLYFDRYNKDLRTIDVSRLDSGNYFLIATAPGNTSRIQFIKQ